MKKIIIITSIFIVLVIGVVFLIKANNNKIQILFYNTSEIQKTKILSIITEDIDKITYDSFQSDTLSLKELLNINRYDLVFTNESNEILKLSSFLSKDIIENINVSSTIKKFTKLSSGAYIYPIEIDHIELAVRNDVYNTLYNENINIVNLEEFERALKASKKNYNYPLMISGLDNLSLLDTIFLLTISISGNKGLNKLYSLIETGNFDEIHNTELNNSKTFKDVLDYLIKWRKEGILHPEWLRFSKEDVNSFIEDQLSAAFILRLSEHREYDLKTINNFKAVKFPSTYDKKYATDILSIPLVSAIPESSKTDLGKKIIELLLNESSQKKLTYATGLAPVHSNVTAMDVQASNLRYWVAASSSISTAYYLFPQNDTLIESFLDNVRVYLK